MRMPQSLVTSDQNEITNEDLHRNDKLTRAIVRFHFQFASQVLWSVTLRMYATIRRLGIPLVGTVP